MIRLLRQGGPSSFTAILPILKLLSTIALFAAVSQACHAGDIFVANSDFTQPTIRAGTCNLPSGCIDEPPDTVIRPDSAYLATNFPGIERSPGGSALLSLGAASGTHVWLKDFLKPNSTYKIAFDLALPKDSPASYCVVDLVTRLGLLFRSTVRDSSATEYYAGQVAAPQGKFTHEELTYTTAVQKSGSGLGSQIGLVFFGCHYLITNVRVTEIRSAQSDASLELDTMPATNESTCAIIPFTGVRRCPARVAVTITAHDFQQDGVAWRFDHWKGDVSSRYSRAAIVKVSHNCRITAVYKKALPAGAWDTNSDTWSAVDDLGRALPDYKECGPPRKDRLVLLQYEPWHGQELQASYPYDNSVAIAANPSNPKWCPQYQFSFWSEPLFGYYHSDDEYVIRKHAAMLADAGVDAVSVDSTNGMYYPSILVTICRVFEETRNNGGVTPQIVQLTDVSHVQALYDTFYGKNLYSDLWFKWGNKPLILVHGDLSLLSDQLKSYFTIRECWFQNAHKDTWDWAAVSPQPVAWHDSPAIPEEISVAMATHPTTNHGRSFHNGAEPPIDKYDLTGQQALGLFFSEQWKRALAVDPTVVYITSWNEFVAFRNVYPDPIDPWNKEFLGRRLSAGDTYFVDEFNQEFSRDAEPVKSGIVDDYYYQMVANIRRFKGVHAIGPVSQKTISIGHGFTQWLSAQPEFRHAIGAPCNRYARGYGDESYINTTARNNIVAAKVAYDRNNIYFYVRTAHTLTAPAGDNWMTLFVHADGRSGPGWLGYNCVINRILPRENAAFAQRNVGGKFQWGPPIAVPYQIAGDQLQLAIPRSILNAGDACRYIDFKWTDNCLSASPTWRDFTLNGDAAPDGRFNYRAYLR